MTTSPVIVDNARRTTSMAESCRLQPHSFHWFPNVLMLANSRLSISAEAIDPLHEPWLPWSLVFIATILHSGAVFTGRSDRSVRTCAG